MSACSSLTQRTPTGWIVSATQILFSWFLVWPLEMRVPSQRCLFLILNWTYIYALVCSVIWNMKMHHFVNYLNSDFAPLASYITSTLECTQKHKFWNTFNFFFPSFLFCKIITATSTTLYKNQPHCPNQASLLTRKLYGVMKNTICNIISHYSHYWRKSSGQKEINTYTTIW